MSIDHHTKYLIENDDISDNLLGFVTGRGGSLKDDMKYDCNIDDGKK